MRLKMKKLLLGIFLLPVMARAAVPAGTIELAKGGVFILDAAARVVADPEGKRGRTTKSGAPFYVGETVQTKADGRVKLKFVEGGNEVVLGSGTTLVIRKAGTNEKPGTDLALQQGQVRANVNRKYSGESGDTYEIRTRNAVAGVRGTVFAASFDPKTAVTAVVTERGLVTVAAVKMSTGSVGAVPVNSPGSAPGVGGAASGGAASAPVEERSAPTLVSPGEVSTVSGSKPPSAPAPLSSRPEIKKMVESIEGDSKSSSSDDSSAKKSGKDGGGAAASAKADTSKETPLAREPVKEDSGRSPASTGSADAGAPSKPAGGLMGEAALPPPSNTVATGVPSTLATQIQDSASRAQQQATQARQSEQAVSGVGKVVFPIE